MNIPAFSPTILFSSRYSPVAPNHLLPRTTRDSLVWGESKAVDVSGITDIVRAMCVVHSMADAAAVVEVLEAMQRQRLLSVCRVKDRFTGGRPGPMGWR